MRTRKAKLFVRELESRIVPTAGALDVTFGGDGKSSYVFPPYHGDAANDMLLQSDGKIVLAGKMAEFSGAAAPIIVRLNTDGSLDNAFSEDGWVNFQMTGSEAASTGGFGGIAQQADGKFVAVGAESLASAHHDRLLVTRWNNDGTIDTSFSGDGVFMVDVDGSVGYCVNVQADQKIVAAGVIGTEFIVLRFNTDGSLDPTFGNNGVFKVTSGEKALKPSDIEFQTDGKIVISGSGPEDGFELMRLMPNGTLDNTFGGDGLVRTSPPGTHNQDFSGIAILPDGRIVGSGTVALGDHYSPTPTLMRFNPDGTADTTLAGTGYVLSYMDSGAGSWFGGLAVQPDGRVVVGGSLGIPGGSKSMLVRYNEDGSFDSTFGPGVNTFVPGVLYTDMQSGANDGFGMVALLPDGRIVAAGTVDSATSMIVARYWGDKSFFSVADQYSATEDTTLTVDAAGGVKANDQILEGNPLVELVSGPSHAASFTLMADGSFEYVPDANYNGLDSFAYRLVAGAVASDTATVTLSVAPVNDDPTASDDSYQLPIDSPFLATVEVGVLANDRDVDGDTLTATIVDQPAIGTVVLAADGTFAFEFPEDFAGSTTFTYQVSDGTVSGNIATVTLSRESFGLSVGPLLRVFASGNNDIVRLTMKGKGVLVEIQSPNRIVSEMMYPDPGTKKFTALEFDLGGGDDRLDARGLNIPVTVIGGPGNDMIRTGRGADVIYGDNEDGSGSGTNSIDSGAGNDLIIVGNGLNDIHAGAGHDTILGGNGGNYIDAGAGNDSITTGSGIDWILAGAGMDLVDAGGGNDMVDGGAGNDLLVGGLGADVLRGMGGNDILIDGQLTLLTPNTVDMAKLLKSYVPSKKTLPVLLNYFTATTDLELETMLGGGGKDWFWTLNDETDRLGVEPAGAAI